jgi:phosphatidylglycerol:prolipoprotein diacylglycerol transferase
MTVYPLTFTVFGLEITGFGIMMMVAFLVAGWVMQLELKRRHLNPEFSADVVVAAVIGGILGARLWYIALHGGPLLARGGLVWYGGFLGGVASVVGTSWWKRVPLRFTFELTAPALAVGHGLGRVGCFLVQDDYGIPTSLPWGLRFPQGQPPTTAAALSRWGVALPPDLPPGTVLAVHPTQLYEVGIALVMFALLMRWSRRRHHRGEMFALFMIMYAVERFFIEIVRAKGDRIVFGLSTAQTASIVLVILGVWLLIRSRKGELAPDPAPAAATTGGGAKKGGGGGGKQG